MLQGIEQRPTENGYALAAIRGGVLAGKGGHEKKLAYVQNIDKQPLMATSAVKARMLLSKVKRRCFLTTPFTIQLTFVVPNHVQPLTHAVDPGSGTVGSSVADKDGNLLNKSNPARKSRKRWNSGTLTAATAGSRRLAALKTSRRNSGSQKIRKPAIGSSPALSVDPGILPAWYPPSLVFSALVLFRSRSLPVSFSSGLALSQSGSLPR